MSLDDDVDDAAVRFQITVRRFAGLGDHLDTVEQDAAGAGGDASELDLDDRTVTGRVVPVAGLNPTDSDADDKWNR